MSKYSKLYKSAQRDAPLCENFYLFVRVAVARSTLQHFAEDCNNSVGQKMM